MQRPAIASHFRPLALIVPFRQLPARGSQPCSSGQEAHAHTTKAESRSCCGDRRRACSSRQAWGQVLLSPSDDLCAARARHPEGPVQRFVHVPHVMHLDAPQGLGWDVLQDVTLVRQWEQHMVHACTVRGEDLVADAANRQHLAPESYLTGHCSVAPHRPVQQNGGQGQQHRHTSRGPVLRDPPRREVHVQILPLEGISVCCCRVGTAGLLIAWSPLRVQQTQHITSHYSTADISNV
mmetsp:Transcript_6467/g.16098  ORF Transcript_6467/g.16098 Transcript_6467/m.16098 type:complete len:237 (-) Transcript_6467:166-876(-)